MLKRILQIMALIILYAVLITILCLSLFWIGAPFPSALGIAISAVSLAYILAFSPID